MRGLPLFQMVSHLGLFLHSWGRTNMSLQLSFPQRHTLISLATHNLGFLLYPFEIPTAN